MVVSDWRDKDLSKVVLTDEVKDYFVDKYRTDWVIVISFNDDDLSTDEEIMLMGDIPFSTTDDDSNDDDSLRCYSQVKVTNCVLALRAVNTPDVDVGSLSIRRK
ncbi:hypothetical protein Tco_0517597 [Tanacetum coccineum]